LGDGVDMAARSRHHHGSGGGVFGFTDLLGDQRIRDITDAWLHMGGNLIAVVLALINWYIRYRSGAAAGVFSWGIWLSLATVLLLLFNGWKGWELVYRHHVGVSDIRIP
jgi:uncharacterized membrane protein